MRLKLPLYAFTSLLMACSNAISDQETEAMQTIFVQKGFQNGVMQTYEKSVSERVDKSTEITKIFDMANRLKRTKQIINIGATQFLYTENRLSLTRIFEKLGPDCTAFTSYSAHSKSHEEWCNGKAVRQHHISTTLEYSHICERVEHKYMCTTQKAGVILAREEYYDNADGFTEDTYDYTAVSPTLNRLQYVSIDGSDKHFAVYRTSGSVASESLKPVLDHYAKWSDNQTDSTFTRINPNGKLVEESTRSHIF
jgi:hypothetical protein